MKSIHRQHCDLNTAAMGEHEWKLPGWAEITEDGILLPPFKWDEERCVMFMRRRGDWYWKLRLDEKIEQWG